VQHERLHWQAGQCNDGVQCNVMLPSCGQCPSLHGALVVVATVVVAMAMAAAAASVMQEVTLPRQGLWGRDGV